MMKIGCYILAGITLLVALLYGLARMAMPQAPSTSSVLTIEELPPAPYPENFEHELNQIHATRVILHEEAELPQHLKWTSGETFPEIGSPDAVKGGTLKLCNVGPFPSNFLAFGSTVEQFFHYNLFNCIDVTLVRQHPQTGQIIPGLAESWTQQGNTLYFKLNTKARYTNGRPVRAGDFALGILLRLRSGDAKTADYARAVHIYGDSIVAVEPRKARVLGHLQAAAILKPSEPGFYADFGPDYSTRYAQRIPPSTGAYTISHVQRGRKIILSRNPNWWAKDLPGFRYSCNVDNIEHHFLTDEAQAWELFLDKRLDMMQTRNVVAWQQYMESERADGIYQFKAEANTPLPPYGIAFNASTLPNLQLRRGLMQAMDMKHAIQVIFRGEAERLSHFSSGYSLLQHKTEQYNYNPLEARKCFMAAGYTEQGADGILRKKDGTRLSVRLMYTPSEKIDTLVTLLAQSAAKCGAEIVPEPLSWQNSAKKIEEKGHQLLFWSTVPGRPLPDYSRFFHSTARGHDAPFCLNDREIDAGIEAAEQALTVEAAQHACAKMDEMVYKRAIWLPGWKENIINVAAWPHVHIPNAAFSTFDVADSHLLWLEP